MFPMQGHPAMQAPMMHTPAHPLASAAPHLSSPGQTQRAQLSTDLIKQRMLANALKGGAAGAGPAAPPMPQIARPMGGLPGVR